MRSGTEIRALLRNGRRRRCGPLDAFIAPAPGSRPRFGTIVPKHRRRVVDRNLLRRRLRELGRTEVLPRLEEAGLALDILVRAHPAAYSASYAELRSELVRLTEHLCSDVPRSR